MGIETQLKENGSILAINISGRFDFNRLTEFRQSYSDTDSTPSQYIIDMKNASTIDSSALGMLLNMQRTLEKEDGEIKIINCNTDIRKIFQISRFDIIFEIS